jgi:hypothetical protein
MVLALMLPMYDPSNRDIRKKYSRILASYLVHIVLFVGFVFTYNLYNVPFNGLDFQNEFLFFAGVCGVIGALLTQLSLYTSRTGYDHFYMEEYKKESDEIFKNKYPNVNIDFQDMFAVGPIAFITGEEINERKVVIFDKKLVIQEKKLIVIDSSEIEKIYSDTHIYLVLKNGTNIILSYSTYIPIEGNEFGKYTKQYIKRLSDTVIKIKKALGLN